MSHGSSVSQRPNLKSGLNLNGSGRLPDGTAFLSLIAAVLLLFTVFAAGRAHINETAAENWSLGRNFWASGEYESALACWSEGGLLSDLAPRAARTYYWRARALEKLGRDAEADALRHKMARKFPFDYYTFASFPNGAPATFAKRVNTLLAGRMYPTPWRAEVEAAASSSGLPRELIWAVMRRESKFRSGAVSRRGAVGLMQLMPATAEELIGASDIEGADIKRADHNVMLGAEHLAALAKSYGGSLPKALAAYNAGCGAVRKWGTLGARDWMEWVEAIPYPETREYVRSVIENYEVYRLLGGADGAKFDMRGKVLP